MVVITIFSPEISVLRFAISSICARCASVISLCPMTTSTLPSVMLTTAPANPLDSSRRNASRCIGKYVYEKGLTDKEVITLETLSGIKILKLHTGNGVVKDVTVDMGTPLLSNPGQIATKTGGMLAETILADGKEYKGTFVCMGNPHVVIFVDDIKEVDLPAVGPKLENHPLFPERTNVEFVEILPDQSLRMRVWERGSGITMACGTGACATAVAAVLNHKAGRKSWVRMDGGDLHIHWNEKDGHVYMTGPAGKVFEGEIEM